MNQPVERRRVVIRNPEGMHARAADLFSNLASRFESTIVVVKGNQRVDGKSIFEIFTLAAMPGTELWIEATGPDARQAAEALCVLVESGFAAGRTTDSQ